MRKGWFRLPGIQDGDRTPEEQCRGLEPVLAAANGKLVLDLGSAEGLIAREFARAGGKVTAIELLADHCIVAREVCKGLAVKVIQSELKEWVEKHPQPDQFDIVLVLSIAHKLHDPGALLDWAARSARELVVFRGPGKVTGKSAYWDGWLHSKFGQGKCHVPSIMQANGFREGETLDSAQGERVQYWWLR